MVLDPDLFTWLGEDHLTPLKRRSTYQQYTNTDPNLTAPGLRSSTVSTIEKISEVVVSSIMLILAVLLETWVVHRPSQPELDSAGVILKQLEI